MKIEHVGRLRFLLFIAFATARAAALEAGRLGDEPVLVDVTETLSVIYNIDNRDTKPSQVATLANDNWGVVYNRVNLQASSGSFQFGLRLDNAWFYTSPNPTQIGLDLVDTRPSGTDAPTYFRSMVNQAALELSNRYINWMYPAKYYVGYVGREVELTVGDSSAQFGRGLVLSVRKLDELASDTTVRGARAALRLPIGDFKLRLTALGGVMNPLRIDPTSGRYLGVHSSVTPSWTVIPEAGMPRAVATDAAPEASDCKEFKTCSYAPDRMAAGQLELESKRVRLGTQASVLFRQDPLSEDIVRRAQRIVTASQALELVRLGEYGALYIEAAIQDLAEPSESEARLDAGHALYSSLSLGRGPFTLLFEGRHYRRFFPLLANVSVSRAREFNTLAYNAPPTAEAQWVDSEFESFNTCVTGGRAKLDVELSERVNVFGWVGHHQSYAESVSNEACDTRRAHRNIVWDTASGFELFGKDRQAKTNVTLGVRSDDADQALPTFDAQTHVFYREAYARFDAVYPLVGPYSLELHGVHRRRRLTVGGPNGPWLEGQQIVSVNWAPRLSVALGFEYDTSPLNADTYYNGQISYRVTQASNVSLFVGQRRGALRCVGGVCRVFPPFEGAQLDVTARF